MNAPMRFLEIHFHLTDGTVTRFVHDDAATAQQLLDSIHPDRVFSPHEILIAGKYSMTAVPTARIARIDLVTDRYPGWPFPNHVQDVVQIPHEQFQEREVGKPGAMLRADRLLPTGAPVVTYVEIVLLNAEKLYLEFHLLAQAQTPVERGLSIHQFLSNMQTLTVRRHNGGAILVNPVNIVQLSLFPGPPETPPNAWLARHLTIT